MQRLYEVYTKLRTEKGVRDFDVAKETGISPDVFSSWKKGYSVPKFDKLVKIADYFGVSIERFAEAIR